MERMRGRVTTMTFIQVCCNRTNGADVYLVILNIMEVIQFLIQYMKIFFQQRVYFCLKVGVGCLIGIIIYIKK